MFSRSLSNLPYQRYFRKKRNKNNFSLTYGIINHNFKGESNFLYSSILLTTDMKRTFSILLTFLILSFAISVQAEGRNLQSGEYKLFAYSLSNGDSAGYSNSISSKNISFHSLFISSEAMKTVLNREEMFLGNSHIDINKDNYQGLAIRAAFAPTDGITFHSSIGLTDTLEETNLDYTDRIGWEVDLGVAYKFLNKFAYEVHFGYMDTGELFKDSTSYTNIEDITIVTNKLTMSF